MLVGRWLSKGRVDRKGPRSPVLPQPQEHVTHCPATPSPSAPVAPELRLSGFHQSLHAKRCSLPPARASLPQSSRRPLERLCSWGAGSGLSTTGPCGLLGVALRQGTREGEARQYSAQHWGETPQAPLPTTGLGTGNTTTKPSNKKTSPLRVSCALIFLGLKPCFTYRV